MESKSVQNGGGVVMGRLRRFWSGNNRVRLLLTMELAVMLPAVALIVLNFYHLKSIERDKALEAAIHREFSQMLAYLREDDQSEGLQGRGRDAEPLPAAGH